MEKRVIFTEDKDYDRFLRFTRDSVKRSGIDLVCYCLMPNHFHFLIYQSQQFLIIKFMKSLATKYSTYFNHKYDRVGHLFQSCYRARVLKDTNDLLNTSAYIHNNPRNDGTRTNLKKYKYSSYPIYLGLKKCDFITQTHILNILQTEDYKKYVDSKMKERIDLG